MGPETAAPNAESGEVDLPDCDRVSVVIPARDEESQLPATLESLRGAPVGEVIVADGGSRDRTPEIAREFGARVVDSEPGRAVQLNAAAAVATGQVLLCLHADTVLPSGFLEEISRLLRDPRVVAGAFRLRIGESGWKFRFIEGAVNLRSRWLGLPYGDQALFVRMSAFREVGGYPKIPTMEDLALVRRLRRVGRIRLATSRVITSARFWVRNGVMKTTLINQACLLGFFLGVRPERLAQWRGSDTALPS